MRIANNIMAMNTHRQYAMNNDRVQASAEKLSSGYRINRAADDAAGLAISEKMRSQIRGLNMAAKNSQDAVSLIQTAEGALQEVHSMLQRMNELAVQSATGTNEGFDRTQIAKEFEQLKREINDISEQTTFNNMKLLDGSLSAKGLQRSKYSSGVYTNFEQMVPETNVGGLKTIQLNKADQFKAQTPASFEIDLTGYTIDSGDTGSNIKLEIGSESIVTDADFDADDNLSGKKLASKLLGGDAATKDIDISVNVLNAKTGLKEATTVTFTASVSDKGLKLEVKNNNYTIDADAIKELKFKVSGTNVDGTTELVNVKDAIVAGKANIQATVASSSFEFVYDEIHSGDAFTIGEKTYVFYNSTSDDTNTVERLQKEASSDAGNRFALDLAKITSASQLAIAINKAQGSPEGPDADKAPATVVTPATNVHSVTAKADGSVINLTYIGTAGAGTADTNEFGVGKYGVAGNKYVAVNSKPLNDYSKGVTTFEIDVAKLKVGDKLVYQTKSASGKVTELTYEYQAGHTVDTIRNAFGIKEVEGGDVKIDGNSWTETGIGDQGSRLSFIAVEDYKKGTYEPMKIQVGALEGEQLSIKIAAMNTAGLGLDDDSIYTQATAGKAVTATREAINIVSDQRALLGAMQNRMTHKIANLKVSVENLQASESRIRDIDIASEMTTFTKNNILSQAATSMLAQANSAPQNVLSLLK